MTTDWVPAPAPQQNPIPKRRSQHFTDALQQSVHGSVERAPERGYTMDQIYQTAAYGQEYPNNQGRPDVSIFKLNSIATPGTRRRIVVNVSQPPKVITVLPREPIPDSGPSPQKKAPSNSKKRQKEQLAKKRARSSGQ